eukprot:CAMPEP_0117751644 /NCGR_PEP_ID=MMETSP0947-20121206/11104_1 /TAXON_ID=44440 /ORGANISM="Chattonella subsalsa, Strain CCMP2191" /LENGTH=220 /DNA_ID=CAMNT_0005570077 /DNA_START=260 /DNA_END=922 /DNA_ORIENTATION=-
MAEYMENPDNEGLSQRINEPESLNQKSSKAQNALNFFRFVGKLKEVKRTGWIKKGINSPESVSDHMYRMAMCSFLIDDRAVDKIRCMKIAVVHDLAEALVGDITPHCGVSKEEKRILEEQALNDICTSIGNTDIANEIRELWLEYEDGTSPEAAYVKDLDKFEMILQADEYERAQGTDLGEFFQSTEGKFQTGQVQEWDAELRSQRQQRIGASLDPGPSS